MPEPQKRIHARIDGRVQGVGFRYFVQRSAADKKVTGWVRNRWDGSVEVIGEGDETALHRFVADLRKGPTGANVTALDLTWEDSLEEFNAFSIRRTG